MAVPVALVVASVTHAEALAEGTAQSLARHQVDAELVADGTLVSRGPEDVPLIARAPVVWRGPSGEERRAVVDVRTGAGAGTTVPVWVDRQGDLTTRPLDGSDAVARAAGTAVGTYLCLSALAAGGYLALSATLDRRRLRRWAADWAVIEPVWSRKVS
jgi:hypothetical protein